MLPLLCYGGRKMKSPVLRSLGLMVLAGTLFSLMPSLNAALPGSLEGVASEIASSGGDWAIGVIEFDSGDRLTLNPDERFPMEIPHLPLTALGIVLSNRGDLTLDELVARDQLFWEKLHYAQQGGRGMCMSVIWVIGEGRVAEWLSSGGYSGTEINGVIQDFPLCPAYDPNYISVSDALEYLEIVYDNLDQELVRKIGSNPPLSDHIRETLGFENTVYGWIDVSETGKHLYLIIQRPDDTDLCVVMLADDMDDRTDLDRGFRELFREL